ncbi:hypothetical protein SAMN05216429_103107 [Marinobacter persicus]|uniref:Circularly permuted type 2 ATP-grasp protein n=1 Tax=Marinobacter persicus TaxID=930118 RepID=A0A1I3RX48_9GAMM|nr:hypothetical protein [Marinobacter persicus]SFJ50600.1 hypothetical protein SAMN05216429_103107 [Marinobacter persicus]
MPDDPRDIPQTANTDADRLNRHCYCITLDRDALNASLRDQFSGTGMGFPTTEVPELDQFFADTAVFVPTADIVTMERAVEAIESVSRFPSYLKQVLSWAPEIAQFDPGPVGAFMSYDFHLGPEGPQLIEINTNAGGAFLNAVLARAQRRCCQPPHAPAVSPALDNFDDAVFNMFNAEWQTQRGDSRLSRVAIVDEAPESQFMYPEFQMAQRLLSARGIDTLIFDSAEFEYADGVLTAGGQHIDMVYNRLVDFALESPRHAALRRAYRDGAVVVTPNPRTHAVLADKRNLTLLSDSSTLREWGLDTENVKLLERTVPKARLVSRDDEAQLWRDRRSLFFKPVSGHGSKGVYRGDKLTKRVFENILEGDYIAQDLVPPGERGIRIDDTVTTGKVDIRLYTYAGKTLLTAARIYKGQTTNFRTPGGGFAPIFQV